MTGPAKESSSGFAADGGAPSSRLRPRIYPVDEASALQMGYVDAPRNIYGSLKNSGYHHIGSRAFVRYRPDSSASEMRTAAGIVIDSAPANLQILDNDGKITDVNSNRDTIEGIYLQPAGITWQHLDHYGFQRCGYKPVRSLNGNFGILTDGKFIVSGGFSVIEPSPGYPVMQILDPEGPAHLIDAEYLFDMDLVVAKNSEDKIEGPTITTRKESVWLIDEKREKRAALAAELVQDIRDHHLSPFANPKLYTYLVEDLSSQQRRELLRRTYERRKITKMMEFIENTLGEEYTALLIDPGVVNNFDQFRQFIEGSSADWESAIAVRDAFSKFLGKTKIYRGMALKSKEAQFIQRHGLFAAGAVDSKFDLSKLLFKMFDYHSNISTSVSLGISERQVDSSRSHYIFLSGSHFPEVAASIGWQDSGRTNVQGVKPYLLEIEMPAIDIISPLGAFKEALLHYDRGVQIGDQIFRGDDKLEVFIPFCLAPDDFQIQRLAEIPPRWKFV